MRGLTSWVSWRTFLVGLLTGYVIAWGIHWAAQLHSFDQGWIDQYIPYLTPKFGREFNRDANED
jgi:hypothetical protein